MAARSLVTARASWPQRIAKKPISAKAIASSVRSWSTAATEIAISRSVIAGTGSPCAKRASAKRAQSTATRSAGRVSRDHERGACVRDRLRDPLVIAHGEGRAGQLEQQGGSVGGVNMCDDGLRGGLQHRGPGRGRLPSVAQPIDHRRDPVVIDGPVCEPGG
jgi:hypothetical protein